MGCGHPDKVADAISDAILDACLAQDPENRVGCETLVKGNQVVLAGEITTKAKLDYERIVRDTVRSIGYRTAQDDPIFNSESLNVSCRPPFDTNKLFLLVFCPDELKSFIA